MRDFDDNDFPLAYLIIFRCYGTWLHGDERGSIDRKHNVYGAPKIAANQPLACSDAKQRKHASIILNAKERRLIESAIRAVCAHQNHLLRALSVRTNHVHVVVSATCKPEAILNAFKSYSTRALRLAGLLSSEVQPWARHGSTVYLWKEPVARACAYVLLEQGGEFVRE